MKLNSNNLYKVIQRKLFSEDECKKILNSEITPAPFKTKGHDSFVDFIVPNEDNKWIRDRIEKEILDVNKRFFKFKDVVLRDRVGLRTYEVSHKYDWHTDNLMYQRLTMTVQLNTDYEGGELYLFNGDFIKPKKQIGVITIFPSYLFHASMEVTKGKKQILITHLKGPGVEWYENERATLNKMRVNR